MLIVGETEFGVYESSVPASQFLCKSETTLKNKIYVKMAKISLKFSKWEEE